MPPLYVINLARRPDRLGRVATQLGALGLSFERIDATDAKSASTTELDAALASRGPLGPFHIGPRCCTLSHLRTYRRFLGTDAARAIVLEDDVLLSSESPRFLTDLDWVPSSAGVVKLERFGPTHQRVLVENAIPIGNRTLARLRSKHTGAAAYVISKDAASKVVDHRKKIDMDIDHLLFNPSLSPLFHRLNVYQLVPALAVQERNPADISDVATSRAKLNGLESIRQKIMRGSRELGELPRQVSGVVSGRTRLVRVGWR